MQGGRTRIEGIQWLCELSKCRGRRWSLDLNVHHSSGDCILYVSSDLRRQILDKSQSAIPLSSIFKGCDDIATWYGRNVILRSAILKSGGRRWEFRCELASDIWTECKQSFRLTLWIIESCLYSRQTCFSLSELPRSTSLVVVHRVCDKWITKRKTL